MIERTFITHEVPKLVRFDGEGRRLYQTPDGKKYPSVTSILSDYNKQAIMEWRARVGAEEASKVTARASKRGTAIHSLCEEYIKTNNAKPNMFDQENFNRLIPYLDKIDNVRALEMPLFSHFLGVAGTVDCIADYDNVRSAIDFKTSLKPKQKDWIKTYFMQTAAYSVMFEELTGVAITNLVVLISVDNDEPQLFQEHRDDWIQEFIDLRVSYFDRYSM